jgi:hypothetical protein
VVATKGQEAPMLEVRNDYERTHAMTITRAEAEKAARAGAKVRHECWAEGDWVLMISETHVVDESGEVMMWRNLPWLGGWSIISEALTPQPAPLAERMAALEARMDAIEATATQITREDLVRHAAARSMRYCYVDCGKEAPECVCRSDDTAYQPTPATEEALADVAAGRAMTDDEIVAIARRHGDFNPDRARDDFPVNSALREATRLTRTAVIAEIEAAQGSAQDAFWDAYNKASSASVRTQAFAGYRAAISFIKSQVAK